jgi:hypothetical protein
VTGVLRAQSNSGMKRERPARAVAGAALSLNASLSAIVAALEGHDFAGLHRQWRNHLGGQAPAHLPRWLLLRMLAHRLQIEAYGDVDKSVQKALRGEANGSAARFDKRAAQTRQGLDLKPGALLVREWRGKMERVTVLEDGFAWNGRSYGSLSQIAKAMTGTSWNGHRFFGLRSAGGEGRGKEASRGVGTNTENAISRVSP